MATGQVRVIWRQLAFLGPESVAAAEAAECAAEQGKFWEYRDKLFERQGRRESGAFSRENLRRFGVEIGLDDAAFGACLASSRPAARVLSDRAVAERLGIDRTPTLVIGGEKIQGVPAYGTLKAIVEARLR